MSLPFFYWEHYNIRQHCSITHIYRACLHGAIGVAPVSMHSIVVSKCMLLMAGRLFYLNAAQCIDVVNRPTEDGGNHIIIWP